MSIYVHDPHGNVSKAYEAFTKEVQGIGERQRKRKYQADIGR
jgi:chromosome partitioning protein